MIEELIALLDAGWEFPDAEYKIGVKYKVTSDHVRRVYDEYCNNH